MNATLLLLHRHAERLRRALAQEFPGVAILAATTPEEAIPLTVQATAIAALDSQFRDDLIVGAPALEWIHALSSGSDVIAALKALDRQRVMVATTRGIHGQQMSELAQTVATELAKWMAVARSANIKPQ